MAYCGDGRRYQRTFSPIGFTPADADGVSFVGLLHVPTFGRSALEVVTSASEVQLLLSASRGRLRSPSSAPPVRS